MKTSADEVAAQEMIPANVPREQVRPFEETTSVFEVVADAFFSGRKLPRRNLITYPDEPLGEPVRTFEETLPASIFHCVRDHFFPDADTKPVPE